MSFSPDVASLSIVSDTGVCSGKDSGFLLSLLFFLGGSAPNQIKGKGKVVRNPPISIRTVYKGDLMGFRPYLTNSSKSRSTNVYLSILPTDMFDNELENLLRMMSVPS